MSSTTLTSNYTALDVVEAITLAVEAATTPDSGWQLIQSILAEAQFEIRPGSTQCVNLLLEAMRTVGGSITVRSQ